MKTIKIITTLFLLILSIRCQAQSPIIDLNNRKGNQGIVNAYYKDTNNLLNQFQGTYVLNDGINYLKIVFQKKTMVYIGDSYEDILIGEYQYKKNGIEQINTLYKLTATLPNVYAHTINGNRLNYNHTPFDDYTTDNFRLSIGMDVPGGIFASLDVRKCVVNGQEAIQILIRGRYEYKVGETAPPDIIPNGFFFLIKQ